MNKGTKIGLWSAGGLLVATGLFFAIRALINSGSENGKNLSKKERSELERLRALEQSGTLTTEERNKLNELLGNDPNSPNNNIYNPNQGEITYDTIGSCGFPLGNNSGGVTGCKEVAQIQLAINQKHNNNTDSYKGSQFSTWCCTGGSCDSKLMVDGTMGPCTLKAVKKYYGICCECQADYWTLGINRTCVCDGCAITKQQFNNIISGADTSDAALFAAGYGTQSTSSFSGYSGATNYFNTTKPLNNNGYIQFDGNSLPGYPSKEPSVMGNFYPGQYDFVDDNPPKSILEHSYGMGYSNQVGAVRPSSSTPRPNIGGSSRFQNNMSNMGCNGLYSRRDVLMTKLDRFITQGIRPLQQNTLRGKIDFINTQIAERGCSLNFGGNGYYRATGGGAKYVCDGCPDSGALCNPSNNTCPEGCSCKKATVITVEGGKVAQDTGRLQRMGRRTDDEFNPNPPITPTSGRSVDPTDPRWKDRRYSRFTGPNNEHQPGNFLTDDPGDTQSMNEFINDVP